MMKPSDLINHWESSASGALTESDYCIRLAVEDAAKLEALQQMYPKRSVEQLIGDLLAAALYELEESMPYIKGPKVVTHDEFGDAVYEDVGPTAEFLSLAQSHLKRLKTAGA